VANELVTSNQQIAPISSNISLPIHDTPQVDLDTGNIIAQPEGASKLDARAIEQSRTGSKTLSPKRFWNNSIKQVFNSLSPHQQKAWLDSFAIAEKSFTKTVDGLKASFASLDDVAGVLAPYVDQIVNVVGTSPANYVQNLINADAEATQDPVSYILKIMSAKGVTFAQLGAGIEPMIQKEENNAKLAPVLNKISELERKIEGRTQSNQREDLEAEAEDISNQIREFYNQTDSSGRQLYPNWQDYINDILPLYLAGTSLNDAYDTIVEQNRAQIPSNQIRVAPTPEGASDRRANDYSSREIREREKKMLVNVIDQLKQSYN
jgi:hypothetical protein